MKRLSDYTFHEIARKNKSYEHIFFIAIISIFFIGLIANIEYRGYTGRVTGDTNYQTIVIYEIFNQNTTYNLTVLDGEYLYIPQYKKFVYLAFDLLFFQGKDIRTDELLKNRLLLCAKVLKDVFI